MYLHMKTCTQMFMAALFKIVKKWKWCKYLTTDEWIRKMWYIHILEYCYAIKRNEVLIPATTWINLEKIMQSEISQTQKAIYCMISFIWNIYIYSIFHIYSIPFIWTGKSTETKNRSVVARSNGEGEWRVTADGYEASFGDNENVLELYRGDYLWLLLLVTAY